MTTPTPAAGSPFARAGAPADRATDTSAAGPATAPAQDATAILDAARAAVDPELRQAIDSLPEAMRRIARYHFGWEYEQPKPTEESGDSGTPSHGSGGHPEATGRPALPPTAGRPGKAIRPALVFAAAGALGGRTATAARAAAAVELVHNFTLLHDDVMDRDTTRRHRPTAWTVFGVADAILAGDALQALAQRLLAEDPHPVAPAAAARLAACVIELCEGQQVDTSMEDRGPDEVTLDECLAMAEAKTGALIGCACALGALYAGAREEDVAALDAFGRQAGLAFQLIDDVIGIWGDPRHTGKPAGADLLARKKSLPVVAALASGTPAAAALAELYRAPATQAATDLERTIRAVEQAGGRDWAQLHAADRMARAVQHLSRVIPDPAAAGGLLALAEFVTRRRA